MVKSTRLQAQQLYQKCDSKQLGFSSTVELKTLPTLIGQSRALEAVEFGLNINSEGYNLFVMGATGAGKFTLVKRYLDEHAPQCPQGQDWLYYNNFSNPQNPEYVSLPAGEGRQLCHDVEQMIKVLTDELPRVFDDEYYRGRLRAIEETSRKHRVRLFGTLQAEADRKGVVLLRMQDNSYAFAARRNGEPMTADEFEQLPIDQQEQTEDSIASLHEELQHTLLELREWERENLKQIAALNDEVALEVISRQVNKLKHAYPKTQKLQQYFDDMLKDLRQNVDSFLRSEQEHEDISSYPDNNLVKRYQLNVIVDNHELHGAPVVYESLPNHQSLLGCVENMAMMGALITDFSLIKAGAIHRANGGFLVLDAEQLLMQPYTWLGLKRALQTKELDFDTLDKMYSLVSTVSLEPEPIPLDLKVVLLGDRQLYYQLYDLDPEFAELFKVVADFEEKMERNSDNDMLYARLMATIIQEEGLLHLDNEAVAKVIEYAAREVEEASQLSLHQSTLTDLLRESTYWARRNGHSLVTQDHIKQTVESRIKRVERIRTQLYQQIKNNVTRIEVNGKQTGQVNALSIITVGGFSFGQPSRLTATCRYGDGEVLDIDREVELGGDLHSKSVLIITSYLGSRYAKNKPLAMSASLAFEQSYGEVDGDSASLAELCALLSAIAEVPLRQDRAVTGSMNQHGDAQAIGGVNEKIEGFYDVCQQLGFTGQQGVIIPYDNIQHLMLRQDVIESVESGQFHIYAVKTIDQALALLSDNAEVDLIEQEHYPVGSFNDRVVKRIASWAETHQQVKHEE